MQESGCFYRLWTQTFRAALVGEGKEAAVLVPITGSTRGASQSEYPRDTCKSVVAQNESRQTLMRFCALGFEQIVTAQSGIEQIAGLDPARAVIVVLRGGCRRALAMLGRSEVRNAQAQSQSRTGGSGHGSRSSRPFLRPQAHPCR